MLGSEIQKKCVNIPTLYIYANDQAMYLLLYKRKTKQRRQFFFQP